MSNILDTLKNLVQPVAVGLASALGTPAAGLAIAAMSNAIFGHPKASEQEIVDALQSQNPDVLLKLKQAEYDFVIHQKEQENETLRLQLADVANARDRERAVKDNTPRNLAYIVTAAFLIFYACMWKFSVQPDMRDIANAFGQTLLNTFVGAMAYYLGTSVGSKNKDNVIATLKK